MMDKVSLYCVSKFLIMINSNMLKRIIFTVLVVFVLSNSYGQRNAIKASALTGNLGLQYERAIGNRFSILGQVGRSRITNSVNDVETRSTGLAYHIEGRYYLSGKKQIMEGWHIGPFYTSINTEGDEGLKTDISSIGATLGHQWVFRSDITLGLALGAGTFDLDSDQNRGILLEGLNFWPLLGINIGYRF